MSSDDVVRYREYFKKQRHRLRHKAHIDLTHFVIVAPGFRGDVKTKLERLQDDGLIVSLVSAALIDRASRLIGLIEYADIHLLDLRRLFSQGVANEQSLHACFCTERCICSPTLPTEIATGRITRTPTRTPSTRYSSTGQISD